ncbi:MAG TPA: hypothetical protein DCX14_08280 [Flavobacteriales bacterium]|nr:hypothetical protein [Flavobacteriales bacterium]
MDELIASFKLERVGKSGSKFDADKTRWYNQTYLRTKSNQELAELLKPTLVKESIPFEEEKLPGYVDLMKDRAFFVADMIEGAYLFIRPTEYDEKLLGKKWKEGSADLVLGLVEAFSKTDYSAETLHATFSKYLEENGIGMGAAMPLLRVFITGRGVGPGMFETMEFLGRDESESRLKLGLESRT